MAGSLRILLVEDSALDAELVCDELRRGGLEPVSERVDTPGSVAAALDRGGWEIVVCDHGLVGFGVPDVLRMVDERGLDLPVVVVSGAVGEESAAEIMRLGARDLVLKANLGRLVPAIERELAEAAGRRQRRRAEEALRQGEEQYRELFEGHPQPMWVYDLDTLRFLAVNDATVRTYGFTRDELLGMTVADIRPPEDVPALLDRLAVIRDVPSSTGPWRHRRKDGTVFEVEINSSPLPFAGRQARLVMTTDVSERRHLEEQLRQSQKMEAIGQLAGGIAHDFNNLLTAITGYAELLDLDSGDGEAVRRDAAEICRAADRAADLTRQLLAFGRRQMLQPRVLDPNAVVTDLERMLARLLGDDVEVACRLDPEAGRVLVDPGQLEQVLVNLAVNARDAMAAGGKLAIETAGAVVGRGGSGGHAGMRPGRYVRISVSDTGHGMDAETQARVFEPFFTTKREAEGTGLGLATVYGIVKQSEGYVWVESEQGRGTTFEVYLPRVEAEAEPGEQPVARPSSASGSETILVAEDEEAVRKLVRTVLERHGYMVLDARSGTEALEVATRHEGPIDLLLTDTVMPGLVGPELARRLRALRPGARILYMSGYAHAVIQRHGVIEPGAAFMHKPFSPSELAERVREVLDAPA